MPSRIPLVDKEVTNKVGLFSYFETKFYANLVAKGRFVHKFVEKTDSFTLKISLKFASKFEFTHNILKLLYPVCGQFVRVSWSAWCSAQQIFEIHFMSRTCFLKTY